MMTYLKNFLRDRDGAVTVDWVVLTASIVGLGVGVVATLLTANNTLGERVAESMQNAEVKSLDLD